MYVCFSTLWLDLLRWWIGKWSEIENLKRDEFHISHLSLCIKFSDLKFISGTRVLSI